MLSIKRYFLFLLSLLGKKNCLDVGEDTTLGNGDTRQELVQFFVITDGQLQVTRDDASFLVVSGSIACQLQNFSSQVFHDGCEVNWCTGSNSFSIVAFPQQTMDTTNRKLKSSTA